MTHSVNSPFEKHFHLKKHWAAFADGEGVCDPLDSGVVEEASPCRCQSVSCGDVPMASVLMARCHMDGGDFTSCFANCFNPLGCGQRAKTTSTEVRGDTRPHVAVILSAD